MADTIAKDGSEEAGERSGAHLAGGFDELAVLNRAESRNVASDRDVIWRIREDEIRTIVAQEGLETGSVARIPAVDSVISDQPKIARSADRDGIHGWQLNRIFPCRRLLDREV